MREREEERERKRLSMKMLSQREREREREKGGGGIWCGDLENLRAILMCAAGRRGEWSNLHLHKKLTFFDNSVLTMTPATRPTTCGHCS